MAFVRTARDVSAMISTPLSSRCFVCLYLNYLFYSLFVSNTGGRGRKVTMVLFKGIVLTMCRDRGGDEGMRGPRACPGGVVKIWVRFTFSRTSSRDRHEAPAYPRPVPCPYGR